MKTPTHLLHKLRRSRKALAIPMTFMILFVSMLCMISVTYYFAVDKVNSRSSMLKISTAKQEMIAFAKDTVPVLWQPGSACTFEFSDSGGRLNLQPNNNTLAISIDDQAISSVIFNQTIGQVTYELPYAQSADTGLYLLGDSRSITNQSGSVLTQLGIVNGAEHLELQLRYRPTVSYTSGGLEDGKVVNNLRVYVANLNASEELSLFGKLPVKATCLSTTLSTTTYTVDATVNNLTLSATLSGKTSQVIVPIESNPSGAVINVQIVQSNLQIQRCLR